MNYRNLVLLGAAGVLASCGQNNNQQYPQQGYNQQQYPQQGYNQQQYPQQGYNQQQYPQQQQPQQQQQQAPAPVPTVTQTVVATAAPPKAKPSPKTGDRKVKCKITLLGSTESGTCDFAPFRKDGSFDLYNPATDTSVKVLVTSKGVASVLYDAGSGFQPQGTITRNGACWSGNTSGGWAEVCAY